MSEVPPERNDHQIISTSKFSLMLPKMSLNLDRNPRILDLRQKLNEIKQNKIDKQTKSLINDITQQLDEKNEDASGPYSLLFDLNSEPSTSTDSTKCKKAIKSDDHEHCHNAYNSCNKSGERLPNVLHFDDKLLKEYEYSCENEPMLLPKRSFNVHSKSDLCLHFKTQMNNRLEKTSPKENVNALVNEEHSLDDSLGILTPDQMDDICYLDNAFSPTVEGLPLFCSNESNLSPDNSDTPSTDKTESNSAASTMYLHNVVECDNDTTDIIDPDYNNIISIDNINSIQCPNVNTTSEEISKMSIRKASPKEYLITVKEEIVTSFLEDELLPSIHSSILEPVSSIADANVNLDLHLDCKLNDSCLQTQRIEQTPSPEDLPLDTSDIHGEISTYSNSQFSSSTDMKNDLTKSIETSKVSNSFVTSITSITSLDGYQGDGEMSRPVSRGGDHSIGAPEGIMEMDWQNVPVTRRQDPMTDSDFFTESDADGLDDHIHRGDRRAQVIDGALYGGKNNNGNPPLIVNRSEDSCMDSSGVYTDFENPRSSPVFLNAIDDVSPDGSTPSTHSECSQKNGSNGSANIIYPKLEKSLKNDSLLNLTFIIADNEISPLCSKRNSLNSIKDGHNKDKLQKEEKRGCTLKKYKMPKRDVPSKVKTILNKKKSDGDTSTPNSTPPAKKSVYRENLSKKNMTNEIKNEYKKSYKDIKSKVDCSFSLQRSQTTSSVSRMRSSKTSNMNTKPKSRHIRMRMDLSTGIGSGKSSIHSSQSDISATSTPQGKHSSSRFPLLRNGKKRESAPPQQPLARTLASPQQSSPAAVKKNGVVQKLASSPVAVRARTSLAPPPSPRKPAQVRRAPAQRPTTLPTNKETPRANAAVGPRVKKTGPQTPQAQLTKSPPAHAASVTLPASVPAPSPADQSAALAHASKGVEALGVLVQYLVFRLDGLNSNTWKADSARWREIAAAEKAGAARADLDRQQRAQKDLDTIAECLTKISELEMEVTAKEEVNARLQAAGEEAHRQYRTTLSEISALASDIRGLKEIIETLKREVAENRERLHAQGEIELTLRAQLEAARDELSRGCDCNKAPRDQDSGCDVTSNGVLTSKECNGYNEEDHLVENGHSEVEYELQFNSHRELSTDANELAAEVRSLRAVLELKQVEAASLRGARTELLVERERRTVLERETRAARHAAEELRERAAARQRDADRLRDDNRRLREAAARDRDHAARLATLNEELRYKLRQKSQVVSLLAGGGYIERSLRPRTASTESARSSSPPPDSPPSPASSPGPDTPPLPAVKGVVEKQDSVSWVLEIEETPEEVASRLARRSSFRAAASPSGVKRRGGASPGNGSPAPASPAPNASKLFRPGELDFPPAPPPLKESAGEAIYIYDDRQY